MTDDRGVGVANVEVVWSATSGSVTPRVAVTDRSGRTRATWLTGPRVGPQSVGATVVTTAGARSASVAFNVVAPPALELDGVDDFVQVPSSPALNAGTGDFTWEVWVRRGVTDLRGDVMTRKDVNADSEHDVAIYFETDGRPIGFLRDHPDRNTALLQSTTPVPAGEWVHVALTRAGGVARLYVAGERVDSRVAAFDVTSTGPLRIGSNRANNAGADAQPVFPFRGVVHEARVWSVARTDEQIRDAARTCVPRRVAGLVADFRFDEGQGVTARNQAATGGDAALRNGPAWVPGAARCPAG